jgi:heme exporter protein A
MSTVLLRINQLTCIREERILFDQLSFDVHAGSLIQIEGANGTGKTSLLRILAGLSLPYEGDVQYNALPITQSRDDYYQDLTFIGHLAGVKGELSALQNLSFNLTIQGDRLTNIEQAIDAVSLTGFEDTNASHLSAGQNRRIALARLWQSTSKIWILDEPFTAIDKAGVATLETLFLEHINRGGAIIFTSHQELHIADQQITHINLEQNN